MEITVVTLTDSKSIFHDLEETLVSVENPSVRLMSTVGRGVWNKALSDFECNVKFP